MVGKNAFAVNSGFFGAVAVFVVLLVGVFFVPFCCAVDSAGVSIVLRQAEDELAAAYVAVAEAEAAGADVSLLLSRLGDGGVFLSEAYVAFSSGDFSRANYLALNCSGAVVGVFGEAASLKAEAEFARGNGLVIAVAVSAVGLALLVVFGLLGWRRLKMRFLKQILDMKPQLEGAK